MRSYIFLISKPSFRTFALCTMLTSAEQKNLPRKKRRKLEAAREMLEDQSEINKPDVSISCFFGNLMLFRLYNAYTPTLHVTNFAIAEPF